MEPTYFNWRYKCDGLLPAEMCWWKHLEEESAKLRKVRATRSVTPVVNAFFTDDPACGASRSLFWGRHRKNCAHRQKWVTDCRNTQSEVGSGA